MSLFHIKNTIEEELRSNWTATEIAYKNVPYDNNPDDYIFCKINPVTDDRELISSTKPFNTIAIFQIDIKRKQGLGEGSMLLNNEALKAIFREKVLNGVVIYNTRNGNIFQDGDYNILPLSLYCEYRN